MLTVCICGREKSPSESHCGVCKTMMHYSDHVAAISQGIPQSEDIEKPKRYNKAGKLECWDVILDQQMNFLEGSVLKYLWRYKEKDGVKDLKKAIVYLEKIIQEEEKK